MSANTSLEIRREGRLLRLALNRVDKRNALDAALCHALVRTLHEAEEDRSVGAMLLESRGDVFCAGMDLDEALQPDAPERLAVHEDLFTFAVRARKPLVCAVQGAAIAGGVGLVANAHVAIAAHGATFALPEIRIGMWPFVIFRALESALGPRRALELSLTGRTFGALEAMQWGLVHQMVPPFELEDRAVMVSQNLANSSPAVLALGLDFVRRCAGRPSAEAGAIAASLRAQALRSPDFAEGVQAFREKRSPRWPSVER